MTPEMFAADAGIAPKYNDLLGPSCFQPFAEEAAGRVRGEAGRLLEIAAGTGVATTALRKSLRDTWELVAFDLNDDMLDVAKARPELSDGVEFRIGDACALPFDDRSFDMIVCQFGWMLFAEKERAAAEAHRVLKPGGQFLMTVWDCLEANRPFHLAHLVTAEAFPEDPPRFFNRPFGFYDREVLRAMLEVAGFSDVTLEKIEKTSECPSAATLARGIIEGTTVAVAIAERDSAKREPIVEELTRRIAEEFGDEPVRFPLQAVLCSGRA